MQEKFERSAIEEIVDVIDVPLEGHSIYAFRQRQMQGSYKDTIALIEYILCENFNSAWDKNLWADIMCCGYVRDLADWYVSDEPSHKLGTIYALLHSLMEADKYLYEDIVRETVGLEQLGDIYLPYVAARIVERYVPGGLRALSLEDMTPELLGRLWEMIYSGKACCHLEREEAWAGVRTEFMKYEHMKLIRENVQDEHKWNYTNRHGFGLRTGKITEISEKGNTGFLTEHRGKGDGAKEGLCCRSV